MDDEYPYVGITTDYGVLRVPQRTAQLYQSVRLKKNGQPDFRTKLGWSWKKYVWAQVRRVREAYAQDTERDFDLEEWQP